MMKIGKVSPLTGKENWLDLDITNKQYIEWKFMGVHIQNAMPNLSADEREFLMTGIFPGEWEEYLGED